MTNTEITAGAHAREHRRRRRHARPRLVGSSLSLALIATTLIGCGSASLAGTYTTIIPGHKEFLSGKWTFTLRNDGKITSGGDVGLSIGPGSHWRGNTFVIAARTASCGPPSGTGTYRLERSGSTLHFKRIKDPCALRATILSYPYKKEAATPPNSGTGQPARTQQAAILTQNPFSARVCSQCRGSGTPAAARTGVGRLVLGRQGIRG